MYVQSGTLVLHIFWCISHFRLNLEGDGVSTIGIDYRASWEISEAEIPSSANII